MSAGSNGDEPQVELDDDVDPAGDDTTATGGGAALEGSVKIRRDGTTLPPEEEAVPPEGRAPTVPLPHKETVASDTATPRMPPPPPGSLSLEQYAWLYSQQLAGDAALAGALAEAKLTADQYAAWRTHWEARMMQHSDERDRWFALVAKLRG